MIPTVIDTYNIEHVTRVLDLDPDLHQVLINEVYNNTQVMRVCFNKAQEYVLKDNTEFEVWFMDCVTMPEL